MSNITRKTIREYFSRKYLDWAEGLPKFQKGYIYDLQTIREHQRKWSSKKFQNRTRPENSTIILKELRFVIAFQLEEFQSIQNIVSKLFPNSEKVNEFVKDLKIKESSINAASWHNIGLIVKEKGLYAGETQLVDTLPNHVRIVHVSYHRIMPSIACLSFTFYIEDTFSEELSIKQRKDYLPPVIFSNIIPFRKNRPGYSMGGGSEGAKTVIRQHILDLASSIDIWLQKRAPMIKETNVSKSVIEMFEITGNPSESDKLVEWKNCNRGWFGDYGMSVSEHDSFNSENLAFCESSYPIKKWPSYILTVFDDKGKEKDRYLDFKMDSLSVMAAMYSTLETIQIVLEKHRKFGFQYLAKFDKTILKKSGSVNALKRLDTILNRLHHEITENKHWVSHSLEEIDNLKSKFAGQEYSLRKSIIDNSLYRVDALKKASKIIDVGLTGYLEVQNIYAMYRLQRWMLILDPVNNSV